MSEQVSKERVLEMLQKVKGPDGDEDIVTLGLVSPIVINKGKVYFAISVEPGRAEELEPMRSAAEDVVGRIDGVNSVAVTLTADRQAGEAKPGQGDGPPAGQAPSGSGGAPGSGGTGGQIPMPNIGSIIAVASGKGGRLANPQPPSIWRWLFRPTASEPVYWTPIFTARPCPVLSVCKVKILNLPKMIRSSLWKPMAWKSCPSDFSSKKTPR